MGLILKHVSKTSRGTFTYRRRVPKAVSAIITKREFKQKLGDSEREALAAYPRVHAQVEQEIAAALRRLSLADAASGPGATDRQAYAEGLRRRADMVAQGVSGDALAHEGESLMESYPAEDWEPIGVSPVDRHTINLYRIGPERYPAPPPTLRDALRVYLTDHVDADNPATDQRIVQRARRVVEAALEVIGHDPLLESLNRETARAVWDHMRNRKKSTGGTVSRATAERELTTLSALINFAAREFDLPGTFRNPFSGLRSTGKGSDATASSRDKRGPLPQDVLKAARASLMHGAAPQLVLIWRLLEGTGCRLAEITGLRVEDVDVVGDFGSGGDCFPHIRIEPHDLRRLKSDSSHRLVPLVGDALAAAREALALNREADPASNERHMLFPRYGRERGSDAASAALMKHIRKASDDPRHTVHSLRHNMKDRLILAEVDTFEQNLILGHAAAGVGDRVYGGSVARLRATATALQRALAAAP